MLTRMLKCNFEGMCYEPADFKSAVEAGWFEIQESTEGGKLTLTVSLLKKDSNPQEDNLHTCARHVAEVCKQRAAKWANIVEPEDERTAPEFDSEPA